MEDRYKISYGKLNHIIELSEEEIEVIKKLLDRGDSDWCEVRNFDDLDKTILNTLSKLGVISFKNGVIVIDINIAIPLTKEYLKTKEVWIISCSTGCTCCSWQDFEQGFYNSKEDAQKVVDEWLKGTDNPLGSQYAKHGMYHIYKEEAELLSDGRMIVDGKVYNQNHFGKLESDY